MAATNASKLATAKNDVIEDSKDILEDVTELVEDSVEVVKRAWVVQNPKTLMAGALVVGVLIGGGVATLVLSKRLAKKHQALTDAQIQDVKDHYALLNKDGVSLESLAAAYPDESGESDVPISEDPTKTVLREAGYTPYNSVSVDPSGDVPVTPEEGRPVPRVVADTIARNVFESEDPETYFDTQEEEQRREEHPELPHVLTLDEFNAADLDYEQMQYTYYEGDGILADSGDQVIPDVEQIVGTGNMLRFGHGSGDPNVVYIRNNRLETDVEVVRSEGKYSKEVLGFDDELTHSDSRLRRFRDRDE